MNELKRSKRRGRSLLAAGAGVAMAAVTVGCGGPFGHPFGIGVCVGVDGGPCFVPEDAGEDGGNHDAGLSPDAGGQDSGLGPVDSGPFGIVVHPDGGDAG